MEFLCRTYFDSESPSRKDTEVGHNRRGTHAPTSHTPLRRAGCDSAAVCASVGRQSVRTCGM